MTLAVFSQCVHSAPVFQDHKAEAETSTNPRKHMLVGILQFVLMELNVIFLVNARSSGITVLLDKNEKFFHSIMSFFY